jgi:hypothetical protein
MLILGSTYAICLKNMLAALHLLIDAGFVIHWEKSSLIPSTDFPFLGFQWNTVQASLAIPQMKVDALRSQAKTLQLDSTHVSTSDGADRPHRGLLQSSPASSSERKVASDKLKLSLLFRAGSSENSDFQSPGKEGPQMDH